MTPTTLATLNVTIIFILLASIGIAGLWIHARLENIEHFCKQIRDLLAAIPTIQGSAACHHIKGDRI